MPARHKGIGIQLGHGRLAATGPEHRAGSGATSREAFLSELPWTCGPDPLPDPNAICTQTSTGTPHSDQSPASAQLQNTLLQSYSLDMKYLPKAMWLNASLSLPDGGIWGTGTNLWKVRGI